MRILFSREESKVFDYIAFNGQTKKKVKKIQ